MSTQAIEHAWQDFRNNDLPDNLSPSLLIEFKHTYFAAFQTAMGAMNKLVSKGSAPAPEKAEIAYKNGTAYVIERTVDYPARANAGPKRIYTPRQASYPFDQMEINDSFKLDPAVLQEGDTFEKLYSRVSVAANTWNKANADKGMRLSLRKRALESGETEYRCYMVKRETANLGEEE